MKDEFWVLRPIILFSAGWLVFSVVLHACRQAVEQRARFNGSRAVSASSVATTSAPALNVGCRVFPPESLSGATFKAQMPVVD